MPVSHAPVDTLPELRPRSSEPQVSDLLDSASRYLRFRARLLSDRRFWRRVEWATWVSDRYRYVYLDTPKVACTTIKLLLQQLEGYPLPADREDIHLRAKANPSGQFVSTLTRSSLGRFRVRTAPVAPGPAPGYFWFCFVRNPYSRLLSAYRNKIVACHPDQAQDIAAITGVSGDRDAIAEAARSISFARFIEYVAAQRDALRNAHWRSQSLLLLPTFFRYSFIGRIETFGSDMKYVLDCLGGPAAAHKQMRHRENASTVHVREGRYTPELAERVHEIYDEDFRQFKYSRDSWREP